MNSAGSGQDQRWALANTVLNLNTYDKFCFEWVMMCNTAIKLNVHHLTLQFIF